MKNFKKHLTNIHVKTLLRAAFLGRLTGHNSYSKSMCDMRIFGIGTIRDCYIKDYEETEYLPELPSYYWRWVKIKDLAPLGKGQALPKEQLNSGSIPVYGATIEDKPIGKTSSEQNEIKLREGDLVFPAVGDAVGSIKYIEDEEATCSEDTIYLGSGYTYMGKYIYYSLLTLSEERLARRTPTEELTIEELGEIFIPMPFIREQNHIVRIVESLIKEIETPKLRS